MFTRIVFGLIALFWVVMNVLLWRAEFGGQSELGNSIPIEVVWEKILTAPDDSSLEIYHKKLKVGSCRWVPNVGEEEATGKILLDDDPLEGMVRDLAGYTIDLDGNFLADAALGRLRFGVHVAFGTNHLWKEFKLRLAVRPMQWDLESVAREKRVKIKYHAEEEKWEKTFSFSDFQNPAKLFLQAGIPPLSGFLFPMVQGTVTPQLSFGLKWEARQDWLRIGRSRVRVYKLRARVLDRQEIVITVSRVGELLRVELPNEIVLINDGLVML